MTPRINQFKFEERQQALKLTPIGEEIMLNSIQERRDSKTIVLTRKPK